MRTRARLLVVVGLAATAGPLTLVFPAQAAFPGKNGRIAFTVQPRDRGEAVSSAIETVLPSGRGRRALGACPAADCFQTFPAWSPDGRRLAFGLRDAGRLAIVRANGTGVRRLPQLTGPYGAPALGAERTAPAISRRGRPLHRADRRHGHSPGHPDAPVFDSAWSRRGVIAFAHDDDPYLAPMPDDGIYTVRPDGSRLRRLVRDSYNASAPASPDWSPYGRKLVFVADSVDPEIHVADAASGAHRRLTTRGGSEPAWSPDGRFIAFIRVATSTSCGRTDHASGASSITA